MTFKVKPRLQTPVAGPKYTVAVVKRLFIFSFFLFPFARVAIRCRCQREENHVGVFDSRLVPSPCSDALKEANSGAKPLQLHCKRKGSHTNAGSTNDEPVQQVLCLMFLDVLFKEREAHMAVQAPCLSGNPTLIHPLRNNRKT